ncbi:hypothetical protein OF846_001352 [Rhodotorula toruloides]|nr:hypothetical protein OF846_001352 [Rhodotorula toruloides]
MTFPLPSTTSFGASYILLTIAARAITANSPSDSVYQSRSRSSGVRPAPSADGLAGVGDVEASGAAGEDDEEEGAKAGEAYEASRRAGSSVRNLLRVRRRKYCLKL